MVEFQGTKFIHQFDEGSPKVEMTIGNEADLIQMCEAFEDFLNACGYSFSGHVDIIDEDLNEKKEEDI